MFINVSQVMFHLNTLNPAKLRRMHISRDYIYIP